MNEEDIDRPELAHKYLEGIMLEHKVEGIPPDWTTSNTVFCLFLFIAIISFLMLMKKITKYII